MGWLVIFGGASLIALAVASWPSGRRVRLSVSVVRAFEPSSYLVALDRDGVEVDRQPLKLEPGAVNAVTVPPGGRYYVEVGATPTVKGLVEQP